MSHASTVCCLSSAACYSAGARRRNKAASAGPVLTSWGLRTNSANWLARHSARLAAGWQPSFGWIFVRKSRFLLGLIRWLSGSICNPDKMPRLWSRAFDVPGLGRGSGPRDRLNTGHLAPRRLRPQGNVPGVSTDSRQVSRRFLTLESSQKLEPKDQERRRGVYCPKAWRSQQKSRTRRMRPLGGPAVPTKCRTRRFYPHCNGFVRSRLQGKARSETGLNGRQVLEATAHWRFATAV